jgi:tRNA U38,U39,U40 pseudouridine synthase TruA
MRSNADMFQEFLGKQEIQIKDLSTVLRENMGDDQFSNFIKRKVFQEKIIRSLKIVLI